MRVAHCDFSRSWRGGQQQLLLLARELARLECEQTFIVRRGPVADRLRTEGFAVQAPAWSTIAALRRAEVMHAHDGRSAGWMLAAGWGARGIRALSRRVAYPLAAVAAWKMRRLDLVLAVSAYVRAQVLATGLAAERIEIVPDGIDLNSLPPPETGAAVRRRLGIAASEPCLTSLGAFTPEKGIDDLLEALALLPGDCRLLLGGSGDGRRALELRAQSLGVRERIVFADAADTAPAALVAAADIFVMPSRQEGLGSSLLIAMGLERAIVATSAGGIPELIRDGENGLLAPPADPAAIATAIRRLLESPPLRTRLARAGRDTVADRFTASAMARATLGAYIAAQRRRQLAPPRWSGQTRKD